MSAGGNIDLSEGNLTASDHSTITQITNSGQVVKWPDIEKAMKELGISADDCKKIADCVQGALQNDNNPSAMDEAMDLVDDVTKNSAIFNIPARLLGRVLKKLFKGGEDDGKG